MRRLSYLLIVLAYTLGSCTDNDKEIDNPNNPADPDHTPDVTLDISMPDLTFEASGGKKEFTIYCKSDWTITNNSPWCKMDVASGNGEKTITVAADLYTGTEDRNTNLMIKTGDKTKVLTVTQKQKDAIILTKDKFDVSQEGAHMDIEVKSNIEYQVSIPTSFQGWIKQTVKSKALTAKNFSFTISANEDLDKREGYIIFSSNSLKDTVYVYQAQKNQLILTEDTYNVTSEGKNIAVQLRTNVDYDVIIPDSIKTWVSLIQTKAVRTDQLHFSVAKSETYHDRKAIVIVKDKNSNLRDSLTIIQGATRLVADTSFLFSCKKEDKILAINTKTAWQANTDAEWCKINQQKDSLQINVDANLTNNERTAIITVTSGGYSEKLSIKQAAYPEEIYLKCSVDSIQFSFEKDSIFLNIETNYPNWQFTINQTWWLKMTKIAGQSKLKIEAISNNNFTARQDILTIKAGELEKKIIIKQSQKADYLTTNSKDTIYLTSAVRSNYPLYINSNLQWDVTVDKTWCKCTKSNPNASLTMEVAENNSTTEDRQATITITAGNLSLKYIVIQSKKLHINTSTDTVILKGVEKQTVDIISNTKWYIGYVGYKDGNDWFSADKDTVNNNKITFSAYNNNNTLSSKTSSCKIYNNLPYNSEHEVEKYITVIQEPEPKIILSQDTIYSSGEGGCFPITITSNLNWKIESTVDWCQIEMKSEVNQRILNILPNHSQTETRIVTINVIAKELTKTIQIIQRPQCVLSVSPNPLICEPETNSYTIAINSNINWQYILPINHWGRVTKEHNILQIQTDDNYESIDKRMSIDIQSDNCKSSIAILQKGSWVEINPQDTLIIFETGTNTRNIEIKNSGQYEVSYSSQWCHCIKQDNNTIIVSVDKNDGYENREAIIFINPKVGFYNNKRIKVIQKPENIVVDKNKIYVNKTGNTEAEIINVLYHETNWDVSVADNWCKVNKEGDKIMITSLPNPAPNQPRKTTITITAGNTQKEIVVIQPLYNIGELYDDGTLKGIVARLTEEYGRHGVLLSLYNTKLQWKGDSPSGMMETMRFGKGQTQWLINYILDGTWSEKDYPVLSFVLLKNQNNRMIDWYIPSYLLFLDDHGKKMPIEQIDKIVKGLNDTQGSNPMKNEDKYWTCVPEGLLGQKFMEVFTNNYKNIDRVANDTYCYVRLAHDF